MSCCAQNPSGYPDQTGPDHTRWDAVQRRPKQQATAGCVWRHSRRVKAEISTRPLGSPLVASRPDRPSRGADSSTVSGTVCPTGGEPPFRFAAGVRVYAPFGASRSRADDNTLHSAPALAPPGSISHGPAPMHACSLLSTLGQRPRGQRRECAGALCPGAAYTS